ncbi:MULTISPECIES: hypothetical protein [Rhodobacterales]|uniref:hypothetical protein n=1 Tax=Roseobacter sp. N2S TaxID=2663844 RepID=UPI0028625636|nr:MULTISPECIES: hypothetical protein [Rhodobacterales]MDR6264444.1 rod shape-determining protein MreD [Roseobacter sp. N2S]
MMDDIAPFRLWLCRAYYLGIGLLLVLWSIVPFDLTAGSWPRPDIFYCITIAYVVRKPEWAPVWAVFFVFFMRDVLTLAPLGLFTLLIVLGSEVVRGNIQAFREYSFGLEWLWMGAIFTAITIVQQILLLLMLAQTPRFVEQIYLIVFTIMAYPVIVGAMKYGFGFTRPRPGELDAWGKRL